MSVVPTHDPQQPFHGACVPVSGQVCIARDTYRLRFECPQIATTIRVGQFIMLRVHGLQDPLIGRAFALYDTDGHHVDIVYHASGKMTRSMARLAAGDQVEVWGPLGNGFGLAPVRHLVLVAGGIGQTPFLALGKAYQGQQQYGRTPPPDRPERITLCYGARSVDYLAGVVDFEQCGIEVRVSTDDGTQGHHGLVTQDLERLLQQGSFPADATRICCCGPEPMMEATSELASRYQVAIDVSLETPMACGIGICFSCVARVRQPDGSWDYRRTCVEGPVFPGQDIVW